MHEPFDEDQLIRYLAGEYSPADRVQIEAWIHSSPEHEALYRRLQRIWAAAGRDGFDGDVDEMWARMKARMDREAARARSGSSRAGSVAAPGPRKPRRSSRRRHAWSPAFRVLTILVLLGVMVIGAREVFTSEEAPVEEVATRQIATEPGQRATVTLVDGTKVHLNVATTLTLPESFASGRREVHLEGEAFFDVTRDEERPFVVHAGAASVEVLGTAFNVQAYADEPQVDVVVDEGRVAVRAGTAERGGESILQAGQMTAVRGTVLQPVVPVDSDRYLAWRTGRLVFEGATFAEVEKALARWYALDIHLETTTPVTGRLRASFSEESLSEVLGVISAALGLEYSRDGRRVTFRRAASPADARLPGGSTD